MYKLPQVAVSLRIHTDTMFADLQRWWQGDDDHNVAMDASRRVVKVRREHGRQQGLARWRKALAALVVAGGVAGVVMCDARAWSSHGGSQWLPVAATTSVHAHVHLQTCNNTNNHLCLEARRLACRLPLLQGVRFLSS